jgi:hypothetical protein
MKREQPLWRIGPNKEAKHSRKGVGAFAPDMAFPTLTTEVLPDPPSLRPRAPTKNGTHNNQTAQQNGQQEQ